MTEIPSTSVYAQVVTLCYERKVEEWGEPPATDDSDDLRAFYRQAYRDSVSEVVRNNRPLGEAMVCPSCGGTPTLIEARNSIANLHPRIFWCAACSQLLWAPTRTSRLLRSGLRIFKGVEKPDSGGTG